MPEVSKTHLKMRYNAYSIDFRYIIYINAKKFSILTLKVI